VTGGPHALSRQQSAGPRRGLLGQNVLTTTYDQREPSVTFYVEDEIASQPACWRQAAELARTAADVLPVDGERVAFVGCGTSWFVAQVVAQWRESHGRGESDAFTASELPARDYQRVVAFTRSGTTTEVVELLRRLQGQIPTLVVAGDLDTPAVQAADAHLNLSFADERSVVQTRFATSAMVLFATAYGADLTALLAQVEGALAEPIAADLAAAEQVTFLGRGWTIGLAHEAALKFRETSSSWAESYPAMDYRHGPISIAEPGRAVWMFGPAPDGLAEEVRSTGALFVEHDRHPLAELVAAQRVAVARAVRLGRNPDQPRNLSRSVVLPD
jgi:fructoselysine-6-P-deglycase FrlB-like protein